MGQVFHSDTLASLLENDIRKVEQLAIVAACDLRYGDERQNEPSRLLDHREIEVMDLGFDDHPGESLLDSVQAFEDAADAARDYLLYEYSRYPFLYAKAYRRIFDRLLDGDRIIIHCTTGKDRTGLASAMALRTLGVPEETVLANSMLTNNY